MTNETSEIKKHVRKTGTTTVGIVCKDGVILAADRRGTYGGEGGVSYVAEKDDHKVEKVNDQIVVTTAGVASDLQKVIRVVRAELRLQELKTKHKPSIKEAANLFSTIVYQNIRQFSVIPGITHFLLAGFDESGAHLYEIAADGFLKETKKYAATGSGMINCNPILDTEYKPDITIKEGTELATKCVLASMGRDPATGEGLDLAIITKDQIKQEVSKKIETKLVDD